MSAKREYLWEVFDTIPQSPKLIDAALIFYHAEVPAVQAKGYVKVLATKIKKTPVGVYCRHHNVLGAT